MTSQRQGTWTRTLVWSLVLAGSPTFAAIAQEPVIKPTNPAAGTGPRLPAPSTVMASQQPDGRIRVTWSRVPSATSYAIVRSVPPEAATPITPDVTDTVFIDSDVTLGKTYYYVISGLNDVTTGLKKGAAPVRAVRSAGAPAVVPSPANATAIYDAARNIVYVAWQAPPNVTFLVEGRQLTSDSWVSVGSGPAPSITVSNPPQRTWMVFRVMSLDAVGTRSQPRLSNQVLIDSSSTAPSSSGGASNMTGATGTVAVTMGSTLSLRVGATASAGSALGGMTGSRWVSLDEGIATVDGSGTVTARATGRAQILAIGRAADGSVRVTLVQVTVSP
jgi:Big-like domain-containing protein